MKILCLIKHKWLYFGVFDEHRICMRCYEKKTRHLDWDGISRWI